MTINCCLATYAYNIIAIWQRYHPATLPAALPDDTHHVLRNSCCQLNGFKVSESTQDSYYTQFEIAHGGHAHDWLRV